MSKMLSKIMKIRRWTNFQDAENLRFSCIKYPKLLLLLVTLVISAVLFYEGKTYQPFHNSLVSLGYAGIFLGGIFYAYGFSAAPATAVLLVLAKEQNIILAGLVGGLGALLSDIAIFLFVKYSFTDEIKRLEKEKVVKFIEKEEKKLFGHYQKYILASFAGFLIASPLPTEIGVTLMAALKKISIKKFMIIAYLLHTLGIFIILSIGNAL